MGKEIIGLENSRKTKYVLSLAFVFLQVCFFRQFLGSVTKVDYMALRHGFIMVSDICIHILHICDHSNYPFNLRVIVFELPFFFQAHLPPERETSFDFQKYIHRSLEEDFKVVVGIRSVPEE